MGTEQDRLTRIERRLDGIERDVGLAINYMRVLAEIMGCRAKLEEIDREMHDNERRDTDPAPDTNGDTRP
jgi:hypothetical protein